MERFFNDAWVPGAIGGSRTRLVANGFRGQIDIATSYAGFDAVAERWPIILPHDQFSRFINPKMASQGIVMVSTDELCTRNLRDKEETLVVQHPVKGPPSPFPCWL